MRTKSLDLNRKFQSDSFDIHRFVEQNSIGNNLEEPGTSPLPFQQALQVFKVKEEKCIHLSSHPQIFNAWLSKNYSVSLCTIYPQKGPLYHFGTLVFCLWKQSYKPYRQGLYLPILVQHLTSSYQNTTIGVGRWQTLQLINNSPQDLSIYHGTCFMCGETGWDGVFVKSSTNKYNMNHWKWENKSYKCHIFDLDYLLSWLELRWREFEEQDSVLSRKTDCYNAFGRTMIY